VDVDEGGGGVWAGFSRMSYDSSVVWRWAMGWMIVGSSLGWGWEFFSSPPRPDRLWGPPNLLSSEYRESFSGCKEAGA
jgi:hypothetical protein